MSDFKKPQTGDGRLAYFDFSVVKRNAHFALAERMQQKSGALRIDSAKVVDPVGRLLRFEGLQEYLFEFLENFQRQIGAPRSRSGPSQPVLRLNFNSIMK